MKSEYTKYEKRVLDKALRIVQRFPVSKIILSRPGSYLVKLTNFNIILEEYYIGGLYGGVALGVTGSNSEINLYRFYDDRINKVFKRINNEYLKLTAKIQDKEEKKERKKIEKEKLKAQARLKRYLFNGR